MSEWSTGLDALSDAAVAALEAAGVDSRQTLADALCVPEGRVAVIDALKIAGLAPLKAAAVLAALEQELNPAVVVARVAPPAATAGATAGATVEVKVSRDGDERPVIEQVLAKLNATEALRRRVGSAPVMCANDDAQASHLAAILTRMQDTGEVPGYCPVCHGRLAAPMCLFSWEDPTRELGSDGFNTQTGEDESRYPLERRGVAAALRNRGYSRAEVLAWLGGQADAIPRRDLDTLADEDTLRYVKRRRGTPAPGAMIVLETAPHRGSLSGASAPVAVAPSAPGQRSEIDRLRKLLPAQFALAMFQLGVEDNLLGGTSQNERAIAALRILRQRPDGEAQLSATLDRMGIVR